jgi:hypothetical protein
VIDDKAASPGCGSAGLDLSFSAEAGNIPVICKMSQLARLDLIRAADWLA